LNRREIDLAVTYERCGGGGDLTEVLESADAFAQTPIEQVRQYSEHTR